MKSIILILLLSHAVAPLISRVEEPFTTPDVLTVFPVPASDQIILQLSGEATEGDVNIVHVSSASVLSQRVSGNIVELFVGHLPVGMYILTWRPIRGPAVSSMLSIQR